MDGGSRHEFHLPHLSPHDVEGPNKEIDAVQTLPMKVMTALVHGDSRSYGILTPGAQQATANHTCECMAYVITRVLWDHGKLPPKITLQVDCGKHEQE
eukprot:6090436-Amphidinium_carterae.2